MTKEQIKPLIKKILKEYYRKTLNESSSGTLEDYEIELENLVIPGVTIDTDVITVTINLEYEVSDGYDELGQFGSHERAVPAEDGEVDLHNYDISSIKVTAINGKSVDIDSDAFEPAHLQMIKIQVNDYLDKNEDSIKQMILNK